MCSCDQYGHVEAACIASSLSPADSIGLAWRLPDGCDDGRAYVLESAVDDSLKFLDS